MSSPRETLSDDVDKKESTSTSGILTEEERRLAEATDLAEPVTTKKELWGWYTFAWAVSMPQLARAALALFKNLGLTFIFSVIHSDGWLYCCNVQCIPAFDYCCHGNSWRQKYR